MSRLGKTAIAIQFAVLLGALFAAIVCCAADAPKDTPKADEAKAPAKIIKPEDAKDYDGQDVTVEFTVVASKELDSGICFLNSSTDRNDPARFTVFLSKKGLTAIKDAKIDKPADFYKKKKIQVTGTVKLFNKAYEIEVNSPDQIKVIEDEKDKDNAKK